MPVSTPTANVALSLVSSLVRLSGRIDQIMAQHAALREDLALVGKVVTQPPPAARMAKELEAYLDATANLTPDPLNGRRAELEALLARDEPGESRLVAWMEELLPDKLVFMTLDPAGDFAAKLAAKRGAWNLDDEEVRRLVYYLGPGEDTRQAKLPWQLAMSVVDALADVAVANQSLLLREDRARPLIVAILERFADADLSTSTPRTTLRLLLKATLNGALDSAEALSSDKEWVNALLSALANAREQSGDDFVVGLIRGRGYPLLVGRLLEEGGRILRGDGASEFERVAADVLDRAAQLVESHPGFEAYFQDHWTDLLHAGLRSVQAHGDAILGDETPLLRETLLASIDVLANGDASGRLGGATLMKAVEAAIAAVAAKPELLSDAAGRPWLARFLGAAAAVVADEGIRSAFTADGAEALLEAALTDLASHPELLIDKPGLPQEALSAMLRALASSKTRRLDAAAAAGVAAVLRALAGNPALADSSYPEAVAAVAAALAQALDDLALSRDEIGELLGAVASSIAANPAILGIDQGRLAGAVIAAVLGRLTVTGGLIRKADIKGLAVAALDVVITHPQTFEGRPELIAAAIESVLSDVRDVLRGSTVDTTLTVAGLASSAAHAVLATAAADPRLLRGRYPQAVGRISALLARRLAAGELSAGEADEIVKLAAQIIAANVRSLAEEQNDLVRAVLDAALGALLADEVIRLRGNHLSVVAHAVLAVLAAHGKALLGGDPVERLAERIVVVIDAGLAEAARVLGVLIDRTEAAAVLAALVRRWALDRVPTLDVDDARFERLFAELVDETLDRAA